MTAGGLPVILSAYLIGAALRRARPPSRSSRPPTSSSPSCDRLGVGRGWRCLEVGAGAGSTARWLAERVGPSGHVLATDTQTAFLEPLATTVLEVRRHDMCADEPPDTGFDLVHTRWMLHWPAERRAALRKMVACLRPGGLLLAEEPDCASAFHGSTDPVVGRVLAAAIGLLQELGGGMDATYGRALFHDMRSEGLVGIGSAGRTHMLRGADADSGAAWLRYTVEKVRELLPDRTAVTAEETRHVIDLLDDPGFAMVAPTTLAVWGRRPG